MHRVVKGKFPNSSFIARTEEVALGRTLSDSDKKRDRRKAGLAWFYPNLPWGAPPGLNSSRYRGATFLNLWEILTFLCCLYVAGVLPYIVAFVEFVDPDEGSCIFVDTNRSMDLRRALSFADVAVDVNEMLAFTTPST
eukprot:139802-Hanusia_phi.AAC.3